jgi:hypothetical protein
MNLEGDLFFSVLSTAQPGSGAEHGYILTMPCSYIDKNRINLLGLEIYIVFEKLTGGFFLTSKPNR